MSELVTEWEYTCPDCGWQFRAPITHVLSVDALEGLRVVLETLIDHIEKQHPEPLVN